MRPNRGALARGPVCSPAVDHEQLNRLTPPRPHVPPRPRPTPPPRAVDTAPAGRAATRPIAPLAGEFVSLRDVSDRMAVWASREALAPARAQTASREAVAVIAAVAELVLGTAGPSGRALGSVAVPAPAALLRTLTGLTEQRARDGAAHAVAAGALAAESENGETRYRLPDGLWVRSVATSRVHWGVARARLQAQRAPLLPSLAVLRALAVALDSHLPVLVPPGVDALTQVVVERTLRRLAAETRFTSTYVDTALRALAAAELVEREVMPQGARVRFLPSLFGAAVDAVPARGEDGWEGGAGTDALAAALPTAANGVDAAPARNVPQPSPPAQVPSVAAPWHGGPAAPPTPAAEGVIPTRELRRDGRLLARLDADVVVYFRRAADGRVIAEVEGGFTLE